MRYIKNLGMKFPKPTSKRKSRYGLYKCEQCGIKFEAIIANVEKNDTIKCKSCSQKTHGQKGTRLYTIWEHMKSRCNNKNNANFKFYGGKGIQVCNEWNNSFISFMNWATLNGYVEDLTIDRIDSSKNYEPSNCQWIPMIDNIKRSTRKRMKPVRQLTKDGATIIECFESVTMASKKTKIPKPNIFNNLSGLQKSAGGYKWEWILENKDKK